MTSPRSGWTGPDPDQITAWNLVQAGHLVGQRFHRQFSRLGLTPTQFGVLLQLQLHPNMSNNEIARSVLVTPQSMSELLESLEAAGFIERDTALGRGHRIGIRLMAAGTDRLNRATSAVDAVQQSLRLSAEQHRDLNRILGMITTSAD